MDHFESIVSTLLEAEGYWVSRSFRVNLTKDGKYNTGKHSVPRSEIEILAMKVKTGKALTIHHNMSKAMR